jgi:hypothetical protein
MVLKSLPEQFGWDGFDSQSEFENGFALILCNVMSDNIKIKRRAFSPKLAAVFGAILFFGFWGERN